MASTIDIKIEVEDAIVMEITRLREENERLRYYISNIKSVVRDVLSWDYNTLVTKSHIDGKSLCQELDVLAAMIGGK